MDIHPLPPPPLSFLRFKGCYLSFLNLISRGHGSCFPSHANEAMGFSRKGMWTHIPAPARRTVFQAVQFDRFAFMVLHATTPKTGFPPRICSSLAAALSATENKFKPYCCRRLFHLSVPSPSFSSWELS